MSDELARLDLQIGDRRVEGDELCPQCGKLREDATEQRGVHDTVGHRARLIDGDDHIAGQAPLAASVTDEPLGHERVVFGDPVAQVGRDRVRPGSRAGPYRYWWAMFGGPAWPRASPGGCREEVRGYPLP